MRTHDEMPTPAVADFVAELGALRSVPAPEPGAALRSLFSAAPVVTTPATEPRRTLMSVPTRALAVIPSKIAAGVLGALLAGSLGAGAMTGTIALTSDEETVPTPTEVVEEEAVDDESELEEDEVAVEEEELVEEAELVEEEVVEVEAPEGDDSGAGNPDNPVSVAAHEHSYDEACGNHGAYVSAIARDGEAACATGGAPVEATATDTDAKTVKKSAAAKPAKASKPGAAKGGRR